jgi:hypothetical protein
MSKTVDYHLGELRLLEPPERSRRPSYIPGRFPPRRPGERREPLSVRVGGELVSAAGGRGLSVEAAAELCLERALIVGDLVAAGCVVLLPRLIVEATATSVARSLPVAKAHYLRLLLTAREHAAAASTLENSSGDRTVDVSLRLFPRVLEVVNLDRCGDSELREALQLEIAAVSDGRTMSEWAALTALRVSVE